MVGQPQSIRATGSRTKPKPRLPIFTPDATPEPLLSNGSTPSAPKTPFPEYNNKLRYPPPPPPFLPYLLNNTQIIKLAKSDPCQTIRMSTHCSVRRVVPQPGESFPGIRVDEERFVEPNEEELGREVLETAQAREALIVGTDCPQRGFSLRLSRQDGHPASK